MKLKFYLTLVFCVLVINGCVSVEDLVNSPDIVVRKSELSKVTAEKRLSRVDAKDNYTIYKVHIVRETDSFGGERCWFLMKNKAGKRIKVYFHGILYGNLYSRGDDMVVFFDSMGTVLYYEFKGMVGDSVFGRWRLGDSVLDMDMYDEEDKKVFEKMKKEWEDGMLRE